QPPFLRRHGTATPPRSTRHRREPTRYALPKLQGSEWETEKREERDDERQRVGKRAEERERAGRGRERSAIYRGSTHTRERAEYSSLRDVEEGRVLQGWGRKPHICRVASSSTYHQTSPLS
ncbi:unnamed protein product, partial [Pylaiella littoralis]